MIDDSKGKNQNAKVDSSRQVSSQRATSMAELMQRQQANVVSVKKGETVRGIVTKISPTEILLDIEGKTDAVVLEKEKRILKQLLRKLTVGDQVTATVLNPESDLGYTVVSLRRFLDDNVWQDLEKQKSNQATLQVLVVESTKGGFIVETQNGVTGFLPNSHTAMTKTQQLLGKTIDVLIVELDRENKKIVFSQKAVSGEADFKKAKSALKPGSKVVGTVINVTAFGVFIALPLGDDTFIDGLIHISEVSWEKVDDIRGMFNQGDEVTVVVIGFDDQSKRVELSIKRLTTDPFAEISQTFPVDKKITGPVTEVTDQGVLVDLGTVAGVLVEGMIRNDKIPPGTAYTKGQSITATVSQVDAKKRRVLLVPVLKEKPIGYR